MAWPALQRPRRRNPVHSLIAALNAALNAALQPLAPPHGRVPSAGSRLVKRQDSPTPSPAKLMRLRD